MRLKIAARQSDLARWQALRVGQAFEEALPDLRCQFFFKSSLGDRNISVPLTDFGSKGAFTEDFQNDLAQGNYDFIVHSWKDLPVEEREKTAVWLTLPRADVRDVLLVPESVWQQALAAKRLQVLTSSPRRIYNLSRILPKLLPAPVELSFQPVRGNVPTRLRKMHEEKSALVLAKAGLDRLLEAEAHGFLEEGQSLRAQLKDCRFMVLPIELNPGAPAQGALAVEGLRSHAWAALLRDRFNNSDCEMTARKERQILARHGGGCHQKIGVTVLHKEYGEVVAVTGETDQGEVLNQWTLFNRVQWSKATSRDCIFPLEAKDNRWFEREPIPVKHRFGAFEACLVARAPALVDGIEFDKSCVVWVAGNSTWHALAARGVWVNGSFEGLGENEDMRLQWLRPYLKWTKLTHDRGGQRADMQALPTYRLRAREDSPDLTGKTHFFWMSPSSFQRAWELFPDILRDGYHGCGPGRTWDHLKAQSELRNPPKVFINLQQFIEASLDY